MSSIISNFFGTTFAIILFLYFFITIICWVLNISFNKFVIIYVLPFFRLFANFYLIIIQLLNLPYKLILYLWNALNQIFNLFMYVIGLINYLTQFLYNITDDLVS